MGWNFYRTDDPVADAGRYFDEQEEELEKLPECEDCGEPIQDEFLFDIDGDLLCQDCMENRYMKVVENYVRE